MYRHHNRGMFSLFTYQEFVSDEVLCPRDARIFSRLRCCCERRRKLTQFSVCPLRSKACHFTAHESPREWGKVFESPSSSDSKREQPQSVCEGGPLVVVIVNTLSVHFFRAAPPQQIILGTMLPLKLKFWAFTQSLSTELRQITQMMTFVHRYYLYGTSDMKAGLGSQRLESAPCVRTCAHHHQVWCSGRIPGSIPLFWTSPPTPFLQGGPVCLGTRWQKWSAATWGERLKKKNKHQEATVNPLSTA